MSRWIAIGLVTGLALAPSLALAAPPGTAEAALVEQELLPALRGRELAARARIDARSRFLQGRATFAEAFPRIDAETLGRPAVLRGRIGLLEEASIERAREAARPVPDGLEPKRAASYRDAVKATLDAEEQADALERALLIAVLARLRDHPGLALDALAPLRAPLERLLAAPTADGEDDAAIEARRVAAQADLERQRLDALVLALRVSAAGAPLPSPAEDLARLGDPPQADAAADRLGLMLPFLDPEAAGAVDTALGAWWGGTPLQAARAELAEAEQALASVTRTGESADVLRAAVDAAKAELEARNAAGLTLEGDGAAATALRALREARIGAASKRVELAEARVRLEQGAVATPQDVERARTQAQLAQDEADLARAEAADARDRRRADALADHAAAQNRAAALAEADAATVTELESFRRDVVDRLVEIERQVESVRELSALDRERPDPDQVYVAVRDVLSTLRDSPSAFGEQILVAEAAADEIARASTRDRARIDAARELLPSMSADEQQRFEATLQSWAKVIDAADAAARHRVEVAHQERDLALSALTRARLARRTLQRYVGAEQRQRDRSWFLSDVWQEISLLPPTVWLMLRERAATLISLPSALSDLNVLVALLASSFWAILSGVAWWLSRGRADAWALMLAERVRRWRPELRPTDLRALREPTARFVRNGLDLLLGPLLLWALGDTLPELRFLIGVYLYLALYRALLAGFELAVVRLPDVRPAMLVLRAEPYDLARSTVRWFLGWFLVRRLLDYLLWEVLGLDRVSSTVDWLVAMAFWGLCLWTVDRWEPIMRERLARGESESRAIRWLAREDGGRLLRIPRGLGQLGVLIASALVELGHLLAREGTSLAWLFNTVSRYRLNEEGDKPRPLPDEVRARLLEATDLRKKVERPELGALGGVIQEWQHTRRRGLVALVGDRGAGKGVACDELSAMLADAGLEVVRTQVPGPIRSADELHRWLAQVLSLPEVPATAEAMVQAIESLPPRAWVIEDIHRCFARRVGGVDVTSRLLYLLNATCDHHFWLVSVHAPAWDYFSSVGSLVDVGVFHTVIKLAPLTSQQLRELTVSRTGRAGLRVDFSSLARPSALVGGAPEIEQERQVGLFYRLLADASNGAPVVALSLWSRCLSPTADERVVQVHLTPALSLGVVPDLADAALFVLVALNLHDRQSELELADVTNLSLVEVRATVRDLVSRGLVERDDDQVRIPDERIPLIQRTLRRRHFLHLGGA